MAYYKKTRKYRSRGPARRTYRRRVARTYSRRRNTGARRTRSQTIRIVVQQAPTSVSNSGITGHVGQAPAPDPKKAKF